MRAVSRLRPRHKIWMAVLTCLVLGSILVPLLSPHAAVQMHAGDELLGPTARYALGTDEFGRDLLTRLFVGVRVSLVVSVFGVLAGMAVGTALGLLAGYLGGPIDNVIMRGVDTLFAFPTILLGIVTATVLSPGLTSIVIAVFLINVPVYCRLARGSVMVERTKEYVESVRGLGASSVRIVSRHILPNVLPVLVIQSALAMAHAMIIEAGLSFLGIGIQPPDPSLGSLLNAARSYVYDAPSYSVFPGMVLTLLVLSLNFIADGIRAVIDPSVTER